MQELYPCFGLKALGECAYNPAHPPLSYFTIGDAVAALAFTLAVLQLLKPIYRFRLKACSLKISWLIIGVFIGALFSLVAAALPNFPNAHTGPVGYPLNWELAGGLIIGVCYAAVAFVALSPARINRVNLESLVIAGSDLLSAADRDDRVAVAHDLLADSRNLERLIRYASAIELAQRHAIWAELERRRERGEVPRVVGRPPISPFYQFAHREELKDAHFAASFLRIISDADFCDVLVTKCPWLTAKALLDISDKKLFVEQAKPFIQQIARQAIISGESIMAKEVGVTGFGSAPLLSSTLFGMHFILRHYQPLDHLALNMPNGAMSSGFVERLNRAAQLMLETALKNEEYWSNDYFLDVQNAYEHLFRDWSFARSRQLDVEYAVILDIGLRALYRTFNEGLEKLNSDSFASLYFVDANSAFADLVGIMSSIALESLNCVANTFAGVRDNAWMHAIQTMTNLFPIYRSVPPGMNPLQQRLAMKLIEGLRNNLDFGLYPTIARVLIATIGPYTEADEPGNRTAFVLLKRAIYKELQRLPEIYASHPERVNRLFPASATYDPTANTITHTYLGGGVAVTNLNDLAIESINLADDQYRFTP